MGYIKSLPHKITQTRQEIACLRMLNQAPRDHFPEFYIIEYYYYTYEKNVQPVNLEAPATDSCLTPILKPRTRRIRNGERQKRRERREGQALPWVIYCLREVNYHGPELLLAARCSGVDIHFGGVDIRNRAGHPGI